MRILQIGGTGNISSSVSRRLLAEGHEVYLLHRSRAAEGITGAHHIICDITDEQHASSLLKDAYFDCVIDWIAYTEEQVARDVRLFSGKTDQYVFISSASCYQKPPKQVPIVESTPLINPYWEYSQKKAAAEAFLRTQGIPSTIVRPSHTYARIVPYAMTEGLDVMLFERIRSHRPVVVHGDGSSLWTLTHADDFARGFCGLLGAREAIGESFHITSDQWLTWDQIVQITAQAMGEEVEIVHVSSDAICRRYPQFIGPLLGDKSWCGIFDNSKIRSVVADYRCEIPYEQGVKKMISWFDEHPEAQVHKASSHEIQEDLIRIYG